MKIQYQEHKIHDVFRYFVEGFKQEIIHAWEATYDPHTGKVIFKLYIKEPGEPKQ